MKNKNLLLISLLIIGCIVLACSSDDKKTTSERASYTPRPKTTVEKANINSTGNSDDNGTSGNSNNKMTEINVNSGGYTANLPAGFTTPTDAVGQKMLKEYGTMFVAKGGATPPPTVVFKNEAEVSGWQSGVAKTSENLGGFNIELQSAAMKNLKEAIAEAKTNNLTITPRGADSGRRNYSGTVELWASRVNPGLTHWVKQGKLTEADAAKIRSLSPFEQVAEIFKLEAQGMYFAKDLSKSIIYSVAPPGTSQHISMLALDVSEHENSKVRDILANHGWFQTVISDLPHFTFLGVPENQLGDLGLKKTSDGGRTFWIPNIP